MKQTNRVSQVEGTVVGIGEKAENVESLIVH